MRFFRSFLALAVFGAALPLAAQTKTDKTTPNPSTTILLGDSVDLKLSPELKKSLDDLAAAVEALALRIVNDPHLRTAALQVATGVVSTTQQVLAEQSDVIQEALKTAADRIATAETARRKQQTGKP